jgi:hypothetical protein
MRGSSSLTLAEASFLRYAKHLAERYRYCSLERDQTVASALPSPVTVGQSVTLTTVVSDTTTPARGPRAVLASPILLLLRVPPPSECRAGSHPRERRTRRCCACMPRPARIALHDIPTVALRYPQRDNCARSVAGGSSVLQVNPLRVSSGPTPTTRDRGGVFGRLQRSQWARTRETWTADHEPPRGAGIERAFSVRAMPLSVEVPPDRIDSMTGKTSA